jgi:hypothetical protein
MDTAATPAPALPANIAAVVERVVGRTRPSPWQWLAVRNTVLAPQQRQRSADIIIAPVVTYTERWNQPALMSLLRRTAARAVFFTSGQDTPALIEANESHTSRAGKFLVEKGAVAAEAIIAGPLWRNETKPAEQLATLPAKLQAAIPPFASKLIDPMDDQQYQNAIATTQTMRAKGLNAVDPKPRRRPAIITENASANTPQNFTYIFEMMAGIPMPAESDADSFSEFKRRLHSFITQKDIKHIHLFAFKGYARALATLKREMRRLEIDDKVKVTSEHYRSPSVHTIIKPAVVPAPNYTVAEALPELRRIVEYGIKGDIDWSKSKPAVLGTLRRAMPGNRHYVAALGKVRAELAAATPENDIVVGPATAFSAIDAACLRARTGYHQRRAVMAAVAALTGQQYKRVVPSQPIVPKGTDAAAGTAFDKKFNGKQLSDIVQHLLDEGCADITATRSILNAAQTVGMPAPKPA